MATERAFSFATLLGLGSRKPQAAKPKAEGGDDDGKPVQGDDESDEDYAKRVAEWEKKKKDDDDAAAKKKAESEKPKDGDEDADRDNDGDNGGGTETKKKAAAQAERVRCATIVAYGINAGAMRQACSYAFDTNMSAEVAIATMDATAADRPPAAATSSNGTTRSLSQRMAQEAGPDVGMDAPALSGDASQQLIAQAAAVYDGVIGRVKKP